MLSSIRQKRGDVFSRLRSFVKEVWDRDGGRETQEGGDVGIYVYV